MVPALIVTLALWLPTPDILAARAETPAAFGRRCIRADRVAPPLHMDDMLGRRALSARRLAALGATLEFQRGLLAAIQVHGNMLTSDDEIRRLAGIEIGA